MTSLKAEFWQQMWLYKRYSFSYFSDFILLIMMFIAIFLGGTLVGGGVIGTSLNALVIGYILWTLIQNTISQMGMTMTNQMQNGILEQQFLMPISARRLFLNKSIVNIIISAVQAVLALIIIMLLTDHWIKFPIVLVVPFLLALVTTTGLGYLVVSLILHFKRIGSTLAIFQYVYLGILLINFENYSLGVKCLFCLLPISPMVSWMRLAVNQHPYSLGFYLAASLFNAVLWLIIGLIMFEITNRNVRKNGSLALY